jgi:hypothetical protein
MKIIDAISRLIDIIIILIILCIVIIGRLSLFEYKLINFIFILIIIINHLDRYILYKNIERMKRKK